VFDPNAGQYGGGVGPDFLGSGALGQDLTGAAGDFSAVPPQYPTGAIGPDFTGVPQDFSAVPPQQYTGDIGPNYMYNQPDFSAVPPGEAAPVADTGGGIPFDITTGQPQTSFNQQTPFGFGADPVTQPGFSPQLVLPPGDINTPGAAMDIGSNVFGPDSPLTQPGTDATIPIADTAAQPGTTPGATPGAEQLGEVLIPGYQGGPVPGQQGLEVGAPDDVFQPPNVQGGPGFLNNLGSAVGGALPTDLGGFGQPTGYFPWYDPTQTGSSSYNPLTGGVFGQGGSIYGGGPSSLLGFNLGEGTGRATIGEQQQIRGGIQTPQFQSWLSKQPATVRQQIVASLMKSGRRRSSGVLDKGFDAQSSYQGHGVPLTKAQ
jgi:hypothetical protein